MALFFGNNFNGPAANAAYENRWIEKYRYDSKGRTMLSFGAVSNWGVDQTVFNYPILQYNYDKVDGLVGLTTKSNYWSGAQNFSGPIATTVSNLLAPSLINVGASPFSYTNRDGYTELIYINGGTGSGIAKNGTVIFSKLGAGETVKLQPNEYTTITYTDAPTLRKDAF
jgi:hypothetical protein